MGESPRAVLASSFFVKLLGQPAHRPPGPRGHWLAGNLLDYEEDRLGFLQRLRDQYGPVARFGARTTVISDPLIAAALLRDSTEAFAVRGNFLQERITAEKSR